MKQTKLNFAGNIVPKAKKKQRTSAATTPEHVFKIWPSALNRCGHTTVRVDDPSHELFKFFDSIKPNEGCHGIRMGRCLTGVPCLLQQSSKFRSGGERWWCPVHQGQFGRKAQLERAARTGHRACEYAHEPVDVVCVADIPAFVLCDENDDDAIETQKNAYAELGIWMGLPPARSILYADAADATDENNSSGRNDEARTAVNKEQLFFPGIHVHARKHKADEKKLVDTNFPAVTVQDRTGRFPHLMGEGVTITSPAALEYLCYMEHRCPVNEKLVAANIVNGKKGTKKIDGTNLDLLPALPRSKVDLEGEVRCKNCGALHEDVGDFFGQREHKKHLCGQCGRAIVGPPNIGNPMIALERKFRREVVTGKNARLDLSSEDFSAIEMWPSTPAVFYSRMKPEPWGIHVHAFDKTEARARKIDDSFGEVWLDGKKLNRADLFNDMMKGVDWMREPDAAEKALGAVELEDD